LGAFKLAAESGKAIVPVSLVGTRRLLRDGTWLPRPSKLALVVGTPILARSNALAEIVRLRDEAAAQIAQRIGEPRLDLIAAGPSSDLVFLARDRVRLQAERWPPLATHHH
jgi:1-acyl-sn-glycerol-3-phosphate acyltransferase